MSLTPEELIIELFPSEEKEFLKVLAGYDRGFLKNFLTSLRAIVRGDFAALRRSKRNGDPYYDGLTGSWRQSDGQLISAEKQIRLEIKQLKRQLVDLTRKYIRTNVTDVNGRPIIPGDFVERWQREAARIILNGNLRAYAIGRGENIDYSMIKDQVFREFEYLTNFANDIETGNLRRYSITERISMYADSVLRSFSQGDIHKHDSERDQWEGWRQLDPQANHCPECPGYATDGYVSPDQIMPIGCCSTCMARCKCTIKWRLKREVYYQDLMGYNANLLKQSEIAEINFRYYKRMGLDTKAEARRYVILKRSIGHQRALQQVLNEKKVKTS